jgi:ketol-acid reductoisomerase
VRFRAPFHQGLNMRFRIRYFLRVRAEAISQKKSFMNAADNGFTVGTYEDLIPTADWFVI